MLNTVVNHLTVDSLREITLSLLVQLLLLSAQDAFNTVILALKPPSLYAPFQILLNTSPALKMEIMHLVGSAYARGLPKFRASHTQRYKHINKVVNHRLRCRTLTSILCRSKPQGQLTLLASITHITDTTAKLFQ